MGDMTDEIVLLGYFPDQGQMISQLANIIGIGKLQDPWQMAALLEMFSKMEGHTGMIAGDEHIAMRFKPDRDFGIEGANRRSEAIADRVDW